MSDWLINVLWLVLAAAPVLLHHREAEILALLHHAYDEGELSRI